MNFLSSEILLLFPDSSRQKYNSEKSREFIPLEIVMRCAATSTGSWPTYLSSKTHLIVTNSRP